MRKLQFSLYGLLLLVGGMAVGACSEGGAEIAPLDDDDDDAAGGMGRAAR